MAKEQPAPEEKFVDMFFPEKGVHDSASFNDMPDGYTPVGENVRVFEALTGRGRGGSRAGIAKFIPERHSGVHEIQHVTYIVTVDAALLGWSVDGDDQHFFGIYGGIGFLDQISSQPIPITGGPGDGGGGFQPNNNTAARFIRMAASRTNWPANGTTTPLTATLTDEDGDTVFSESVVLQTDPDALVGDEVADTTDINGIADYNVSSTTVRDIYYSAYTDAVLGHRFFSRRPVRIRFTPYKLLQTASASSAPADGTDVTLTGTLTDTAGAAASGKTIALRTYPSGRVGDQVTAVTNGSGVVTFTVDSMTAETVIYNMTEISEDASGYVDDLQVVYGGSGYRQSAISVAKLQYTIDPDNSTVSTDISVASGSLLVLCIGEWFFDNPVGGPQSPTITITDNLGRTYTQVTSVSQTDTQFGSSATNRASMYYVKNSTAGACTVTATIGGTRQAFEYYWITMAIHEYTGIDATAPLFDSETGSGQSTLPNTGIPTINSAGDTIVAFYAHGDVLLSSATLTAAAYTKREEELDGLTYEGMGTADDDDAAATSAASWTLSNSVFWIAIAAVFKQA